MNKDNKLQEVQKKQKELEKTKTGENRAFGSYSAGAVFEGIYIGNMNLDSSSFGTFDFYPDLKLFISKYSYTYQDPKFATPLVIDGMNKLLADRDAGNDTYYDKYLNNGQIYCVDDYVYTCYLYTNYPQSQGDVEPRAMTFPDPSYDVIPLQNPQLDTETYIVSYGDNGVYTVKDVILSMNDMLAFAQAGKVMVQPCLNMDQSYLPAATLPLKGYVQLANDAYMEEYTPVEQLFINDELIGVDNLSYIDITVGDPLPISGTCRLSQV